MIRSAERFDPERVRIFKTKDGRRVLALAPVHPIRDLVRDLRDAVQTFTRNCRRKWRCIQR